MVHATLHPGAEVELPWRRDFNALVFLLNGRARFGPEQRPATTGQLVVYGAGDAISMRADETQESRSPDVDLLIMGGRPIKETVAWYGPFVMNTRAELQQAFEDFEAGKLGTIPADRIDRRNAGA
jgi:redox-sensitive bicupin YhaK (pirin superfamily)